MISAGSTGKMGYRGQYLILQWVLVYRRGRGGEGFPFYIYNVDLHREMTWKKKKKQCYSSSFVALELNESVCGIQLYKLCFLRLRRPILRMTSSAPLPQEKA